MNDSTIIWLIIAGIAVVYFLWRLSVRQQTTAAAGWLSDLLARGVQIRIMCGEAPNVALDEGEESLCVFPETVLLEPRAVRTWRSNYGGPSFRIAKGISFRLGQSRGTSESHDEVRPLDRGTLMLTNQRLIFLGSGRTISAPLEKIIDIEAFNDGLLLHRQGKQTVEYFQMSSGLKMRYARDGKNRLAPLDGRMVKAAIDQAVVYRRHPASIGRPLGAPETGEPQPAPKALSQENPPPPEKSMSHQTGQATDARATPIILERIEYPAHSASGQSLIAENVEYLGIVSRKSDGIHCLSFRKPGSSRAYNVEVGDVISICLGGKWWRRPDTNSFRWRERAAELRSFIEQIEVNATDFE